MFTILTLIIFLIYLALKKSDSPKKRNIQENLNMIDNLSGIQFEKYFMNLLKIEGFFNIQVTKGSGDYGVDVIAYRDNERYAFQCKRYSKKVGPKPIGEVMRGMRMYNCTKGIVVTNNYFTEQAKKEATVCDIELWDRNTLIMILRKISSEIDNDLDLNQENHEVNDQYAEVMKEKKFKEMSFNQYREMAKKIQLIYSELGYNVVVTDINTKSKYKTIYRLIHEENVDILSVGNQVIDKIEKENVRILNEDDKHIKIIIPKEVEWN